MQRICICYYVYTYFGCEQNNWTAIVSKYTNIKSRENPLKFSIFTFSVCQIKFGKKQQQKQRRKIQADICRMNRGVWGKTIEQQIL